MTNLIETALYSSHQKLKAKCVPFAGYSLPIWFTSITEEHKAVRTHAGVFDISHMGLFVIKGDSSFKLLQELSCNDVSKCLAKKMVYSMFLNQQGMILDDVMHGYYDDQFYLITNGANQHKLLAWIEKHSPKDVEISHLNTSHSFLAVQGPIATKTLENLYDRPFDSIDRFGIAEYSIHHRNCIVFRTGYTGEDGFELMVPNEIAASVWQDLVDSGVTPCGLGSRDSLRIEKGFPLYGHELSEFIHPYMTQHSWVVKYDTDFIGKDALKKQQGLPHLVNVGLELEGKNIARQDYKINEGGYISSGTFIPSLNKSIALAFVPEKFSSIGSTVSVVIRNKICPAKVVTVPFK